MYFDFSLFNEEFPGSSSIDLSESSSFFLIVNDKSF